MVRIEDDRGHHLVDHGPYARVRHPGYGGMLLAFATLPLALGSWWTFLPIIVPLAFGLRRVWIEDRFLSTNLPGYREYATRVRFRLVAGCLVAPNGAEARHCRCFKDRLHRNAASSVVSGRRALGACR